MSSDAASDARVRDGAGRIFIGIPVLNRIDLLERSLASIDHPARILIVNNNNVDRAFNQDVHALAEADSRIQVADQPRNLGVAASWNLILQTAFATGYNWAFISSNDVELTPGSLDIAVQFIRQTDAGVCHLCAWNCFAVGRIAIDCVGWFDENFFPAYKEDQDYSYRCELAGVRRRNVDGASAVHLGSATIRSDKEYQRRNGVTHVQYNQRYYVSKWGGDACAEEFRRPFDDVRNDWRWWSSPGDSLRDRDWDRDREAIRSAELTIDQVFDRARTNPSDISEHLSTLHKYGSSVGRITEFGTRTGNSTCAFLMAAPDRLISYDAVRQPGVDALEAASRYHGIHFRLVQQDIRELEDIDETDLLFLDSVHTFEQVQFELGFADRVRSYILLHDTETFGMIGEDGGQGIWPAVSNFLRSHADWRLHAHFPNNNGLTILERTTDRSDPASSPSGGT